MVVVVVDGGVGCGGEALAVHLVPRNQSIPGTTTNHKVYENSTGDLSIFLYYNSRFEP